MIPKVIRPAAKHYPVVRPPAKQYKDVTPGRSMAAALRARRPVSLPVLRQPGPTGASDCRCAIGGGCSCPGKGSGQCGCTAKAGCPCRSRRDPRETAVPLGGRIGPGPRDQPRRYYPPVPRRAPEPLPLTPPSTRVSVPSPRGPIPLPSCRWVQPRYATCGRCPVGSACCEEFLALDRPGHGMCVPNTPERWNECMTNFVNPCVMFSRRIRPGVDDDTLATECESMALEHAWHDDPPVLICDRWGRGV